MAGGRKFSAYWDDFEVVQATRNEKYKDAKCRYCAQVLTKVQPCRQLRSHILACPEMPPEIQDEYKAEDLLAKRLKLARPAAVMQVAPETTTPEISAAEKKEYQMQVAMVFYKKGWAFQAVDGPDVRQLLTRYCPTMVLPNRQQLLTETFTMERDELIEFLKNQGFVVLVTDGGSNPRRESVINFILVCPNMRPLLWCCRFTGEDTKDGPYMANMISEVIDEVEDAIGAGKVCAVTTDNASVMKSAWTLLQTTRPGFLATGCTAHTLSLLIKDVLKIPELTEVLQQSQEVTKFIRSHTATSSRFATMLQSPSNIASRRGLKIPITTRWYSHYECIKLVVESERAIRSLAADDSLLVKYDQKKVADFKRIVDPETFWTKADAVVKLLTPIHKCLGHFEKDNLCLSVIYQQFVELERHSVYNSDIPGIETDLQE